MKDMLLETDLGGVEPYARQFVWHTSTDGEFEADTQCDGVTVKFHMQRAWGGEMTFTIATQTPSAAGWTVSHAKSAARGQLSYLRLLATAMHAILDFCAQHAPEAVDVTGFDVNPAKDLQKTRIYGAVLTASAAQLQQAGYTSFRRNGKLWIVRRASADATGIRDAE
jgi:hypothetical protein